MQCCGGHEVEGELIWTPTARGFPLDCECCVSYFWHQTLQRENISGKSLEWFPAAEKVEIDLPISLFFFCEKEDG